jgi:hypothetical protein
MRSNIRQIARPHRNNHLYVKMHSDLHEWFGRVIALQIASMLVVQTIHDGFRDIFY